MIKEIYNNLEITHKIQLQINQKQKNLHLLNKLQSLSDLLVAKVLFGTFQEDFSNSNIISILAINSKSNGQNCQFNISEEFEPP